MQPLPHRYEVQITASPRGYAVASGASLPSLGLAPPVDFGGPGDAWSPEHLLLAAVEACFVFTFRSVARLFWILWTDLEVQAEGTVDRQDGVARFTEILLRPRVTVVPGTNREQLSKALEKTEKACLVSASLSTPIRIEPVVIEGAVAA